MAVNEKTNIVLSGYQRGSPAAGRAIIRYLQDELQRIELHQVTCCGWCEVLDEPPKNPIKGMLKYNVSPWDALGDGSEGLVLYNGTAWVDV